MTLREDTDHYCLLWIGMLALGAYYTSFLYLSMPLGSPPVSLSVVAVLMLPFLLASPLIMIFFFTGYLKPRRGRMKATSLACGVVVAALYTLAAGYFPTEYTGGLLLPFWAVGASIVIAGALSMTRSASESMKCEVLDTKSLKYPPEPSPGTTPAD